jgi:hypothetical protein
MVFVPASVSFLGFRGSAVDGRASLAMTVCADAGSGTFSLFGSCSNG